MIPIMYCAPIHYTLTQGTGIHDSICEQCGCKDRLRPKCWTRISVPAIKSAFFK